METISALEDHLGYWLRQVSNHVSGAFARALQARQVSVAEWVVLRQVRERPEITPGALADELGLTRGAMPHDVDVAHPASPKAAAAQLAAAIPALVRGDSDALVAVLPGAERRFVAVYLQPALDEATANGEAPEITLTDGEFEVADQTADRAFVVTTNLAYALVLNGVSGTVSFDGDCLTSQSDDASGVFHGCISDAQAMPTSLWPGDRT